VIFSDFNYADWMGFLLVLMRSAALILTMPFLGSESLPALLKAGLSLALAVFLLPLVELDASQIPRDLWSFALLGAGEVLIGAILGLAVHIIFTSVQIMGQLAGFQMGFAVANVIDPIGGEQISVLAQFSYLMALLVFFAVGGHHWFIKALADSFALVPPGQFGMSASLYKQMMKLAGDMFALAVRLGAPVIGALLFTQVILGILAKTVPQMNILIVGFPLTISVGLFFLAMTMTMMLPAMGNLFRNLGPVLAGLLKAM
jgi:flagellar biosynthetic protein FliR